MSFPTDDVAVSIGRSFPVIGVERALTHENASLFAARSVEKGAGAFKHVLLLLVAHRDGCQGAGYSLGLGVSARRDGRVVRGPPGRPVGRDTRLPARVQGGPSDSPD